MNTKGIKFLAVLAVLAMAFAVLAIPAPAEESDAAAVDLNGNITTATTVNEGDVATMSGNVTLSAVLTIKGTLTLDKTHTLTIATGGKIVVDGGRIIVADPAAASNNACLPIVASAVSADVLEVKNGGIFGYGAQTTNAIGQWDRIVGILTGTSDDLYDSPVQGTKSQINGQMLTGTFTISTDANTRLTIKGTVSAASLDSTDTGYAIPRMTIYANTTTSTDYENPVVTSGDLTIGAKVTLIPHGLKVTAGKTLTNNGLISIDNDKGLMLEAGASVAKLVNSGFIVGHVWNGTTGKVAIITNPATPATMKYSDVKTVTGYTFTNSTAGFGMSGSFTKSDATMADQSVTLNMATTVATGNSLIVGTGITLYATDYTLGGTVCQTSESNRMVFTAMKGSVVGGGILTVNDKNNAVVEFVKGTFTGAVIKANNVRIDAGASVTVAATTDINTALDVYGTLANGTAAFSATTVNLFPGSTFTKGTGILTGAVKDANSGEYEIKGILEGNTTIGTAKLTGNLIIPEEYSLTVTTSLDIGAYKLIVNGELILGAGAEIITSNASLTSGTTIVAGNGAILLGSTGEFQNSGVLGRNLPVTFAVNAGTDEAPAVSETMCLTAQSIKGLQIEYGKATPYNSTISGPAIFIGGSITKATPNLSTVIPTFSVDTVYIGDLDLMTGVTMSNIDNGIHQLIKGATMSVYAGATLDANIMMAYGSTLNMNGLTKDATITAQTFTYETPANIAAKAVNALNNYVGVTFASGTKNGNYSVTGYTITIDRVQYTSGSDVYFDQRAYISGDLGIAYGEEKALANNETFTITGAAFVPAGAELAGVLTSNGKAILFAGTGDLIVEGAVSEYGATSTKTFVGAKYTLVNADKREVVYIANLEDGVAMVGVATNVIFAGNTIDPKNPGSDGYGVGTYELEANLVIPTGFAVSWVGADSTDASLIIPEDVSIEIKSGASLDAKVIAGLDGQVIVSDGGTCSNMSTSIYQVTWTEGTSKIYAGLAVALTKATAGDVITFQGDNSASPIKAITIPADVTLKVTGTLYVAQITVEDDGILTTTSAGSITMANKGTAYAGIANAGYMDVSAGGFSFTGKAKNSVVASTGALVYTQATEFTNATVYGARFVDDDSNYVLTTINTAVLAGATAITIPGMYVGLEEEALVGVPLTVAANGAATFIGLDITGSTVTATGSVSGIITGISGTDLTVVEVTLDTFKGALSDTYKINSKGLNEFTFKVSAASTVKGIEVASGSFTLGANLDAASTTDKSPFVVGEAATLTIDATEVSVGSAAGFKIIDIDGKLTVPSGKTLTIASPIILDGEATVTGTLNVNGEMSVVGTLQTATGNYTPVINFNADAEILGTLTVTVVGTAVINAPLFIGEPDIAAAPVIEGLLTFKSDANNYVIDYAGILDEDDFTNETGATAFYVNDIEYFDVFFRGTNNAVSNVLNDADFSALIGLEIGGITTVTNWYNAITGKYLQGGAVLEDELAIVFDAAVTKVPLQMSWANGLSLYIDGVKMTTTTYSLAVGAHTVSAQVNAGYACDNMKITFDGAPITAAGIIITVDDTDSVIAVSGDVYVPEPEPVTPEEKSEWTITTILLVVLVILIAIMAVIVALRLNRS